MSNVLATVAATSAPLPTGAANQASIQITLTGTLGAAPLTALVTNLTSLPLSVTFTAPPADTYTATAVALDAGGNEIGTPTPVSNSLVAPAAETFLEPQSITIALA